MSIFPVLPTETLLDLWQIKYRRLTRAKSSILTRWKARRKEALGSRILETLRHRHRIEQAMRTMVMSRTRSIWNSWHNYFYHKKKTRDAGTKLSDMNTVPYPSCACKNGLILTYASFRLRNCVYACTALPVLPICSCTVTPRSREHLGSVYAGIAHGQTISSMANSPAASNKVRADGTYSPPSNGGAGSDRDNQGVDARPRRRKTSLLAAKAGKSGHPSQEDRMRDCARGLDATVREMVVTIPLF